MPSEIFAANPLASALPESRSSTGSEVTARADFSRIRYAQCWEDADVLVEALELRPGSVCLSVASAGDNTLALLARGPRRVIAVDLNPAQLACLELRVAAYRELDHAGLLELMGSRPSDRRAELYRRCRPALGDEARRFWDAHPAEVANGIGGAGKFERYFAMFRKRVLPLVHSRRRVDQLLESRPPAERRAFYDQRWDTWRWRLMFRLFFSRFMMGRFGRDPAFFNYVEGSVADRILARARHALITLDPAINPYLHWILRGAHGAALPFALRSENFEVIRAHLDRLEWRRQSVEDFLDAADPGSIDAFNLSDIFEYMSEANSHALLGRIVRAGRSGARLAYWNTLAHRQRPESMAPVLKSLKGRAGELHQKDQAFFYCRFVIEEVV